MANYQLSSETKIWIPNVINEDSVTFYQINVKVHLIFLADLCRVQMFSPAVNKA